MEWVAISFSNLVATNLLITATAQYIEIKTLVKMKIILFCDDHGSTYSRQLRTERNLSQIELAKEIGVGKSIISLWEKDECEPTLSKLVALSKFFGVTMGYLAGIED